MELKNWVTIKNFRRLTASDKKSDIIAAIRVWDFPVLKQNPGFG